MRWFCDRDTNLALPFREGINAMELTGLLLSRFQFAFTVSFHIIFPSFTIGLDHWLGEQPASEAPIDVAKTNIGR